MQALRSSGDSILPSHVQMVPGDRLQLVSRRTGNSIGSFLLQHRLGGPASGYEEPCRQIKDTRDLEPVPVCCHHGFRLHPIYRPRRLNQARESRATTCPDCLLFAAHNRAISKICRRIDGVACLAGYYAASWPQRSDKSVFGGRHSGPQCGHCTFCARQTLC